MARDSARKPRLNCNIGLFMINKGQSFAPY
jgi:hypothetical protein